MKALSGNFQESSGQSMIELLRQETLADDGLPIQVDQNMPTKRSGERYCQLASPKTLDSIASGDAIPFHEFLEQKDRVIVDASTGQGYAVNYFKRSSNTFIGISMHEVTAENAEQMDFVAYTSIPRGGVATQLLAALRHRVDLVFDVYGSTSYSDNPILAMIYLSLLLKPKGMAYLLISSIKGESADQSPIGYPLTRAALVPFFQQELGITLHIARTFLQSAVVTTDTCIDYVVTLEASQQLAWNKSFEELAQSANRAFGAPSPLLKHSLWGKFDDGFELRAYHFQNTPLITLDKSPPPEQKRGQELEPIYVVLLFTDPDCFASFFRYLEEFYLDPIKTPWQLERAEQNGSTALFFKPLAKQTEGQALKQFDAMVQGVQPLNRVCDM